MSARLTTIVVAFAALVSVTGCAGRDGGGLARPAAAPAEPSVVAAPAGSSPAAPSPPASPSGSPMTAAPSPAVPPGVTAGFAVFDRRAGEITRQHDPSARFRSASLVKLLIALDHVWNLGPGYAVPAADRARLDLMLRSSDDAAASHFYRRNGSAAVVTRMVSRLGLQHTAPPSGGRTGWGSTALSAADVVRVYRYLLDSAPAPVRDLVMSNLHASTRCGTDGFDQSFGIPTTFRGQPWAAKQGWYEFRGTPTGSCPRNTAVTGGAVVVPLAAPVAAAPVAVDWNAEVLHTTGTVGAGDRFIVVVLTAHRPGTSFAAAAAAVTRLTGSLRAAAGG